ncbi:MAG: glycosyltransferase family 39 protein [Flavobacteriaceae bacterium]
MYKEGISKGFKSLLPLLPILLILSVAILSRSDTFSERLIADESKFYEHAENITRGFYTDANNPNFKEGPGYPLYLSISAALNIPYPLTRASHIVLLFIAYCYFFFILKRYLRKKWALGLTYLFVLYPPMLRWANLMYAESLMLLLLLAFCYHFILWYHKEGKYKWHFFLSAFCLGFLALTKIIFAYVIIAVLLFTTLLLIFPKIVRKYQLKRTILIFAGALVFFSPYVVYGYQVTEKFFYLGMHGGRILYFRATPFENEFGNSFSRNKILSDAETESRKSVSVNTDLLRQNHREVFASIDSLSWMEKDSVLKVRAVENMKEHPSKYLKNTVANVSRIFFHFPFSYRIQNLETLGYLVPNIFIVVLAVLGIYPALIRRKQIPKELIILLLVSLIYLGGHTLLGGRGRFLIPVVPLWLIFFSYIYLRILHIRIRETNETDE